MASSDNAFTLSFVYKDETHNLKAKFIRLGYIHQFHVQVDEKVLIIEFDEERQYRVLESSPSGNATEPGLLEAIVHEIQQLHSD